MPTHPPYRPGYCIRCGTTRLSAANKDNICDGCHDLARADQEAAATRKRVSTIVRKGEVER